MPLKHWKSLVAATISAFLEQRGFWKSGFKFTAIRPDATLLVGLQSSVTGTEALLKITCNLAIVLQGLEIPGGPSIWDAHWRQRIGHYMPEQRDYWWACSTDEEAKAAGRDIAGLLESSALPEMERLASPAAMIALWKSGRSPGLTEYQCVQYLTKLTQTGGP